MDEKKPLALRQEVLPAVPMPERMYLEGLVEEPSSFSPFGIIEAVKRDFRARRDQTDFYDRVRKQFLDYTRARVEVELSGELAKMVEELRHAMTMVQLQNYAVEQEFATQTTMQLRLSAARKFQEFGQELVKIGYPQEQIERAVNNTINSMLSVAGAEIATMEGIDAFARAARPQGATGGPVGQRDAGVHNETR